MIIRKYKNCIDKVMQCKKVYESSYHALRMIPIKACVKFASEKILVVSPLLIIFFRFVTNCRVISISDESGKLDFRLKEARESSGSWLYKIQFEIILTHTLINLNYLSGLDPRYIFFFFFQWSSADFGV